MNISKIRKDIKNQNGITLIALVVTIIVLIILAGVSIALILDDNGIVTKAKEGKENYLLSANVEHVLLEIAEDTIDGKLPYDRPYIPDGFIHIGTEDWNSGYTIRNKETLDEFVWVPCVLNTSQIKSGDNVTVFKRKYVDLNGLPS